MTREEVLIKFERSSEEPLRSGTLKGDELCSDLDGWNSLAVLNFISVINKDYGLTLQPAKLIACQTVSDVVELVISHSA
jgi:acyl carrier protein